MLFSEDKYRNMCVYGVDQSNIVGNDVTFMSQDDCVR